MKRVILAAATFIGLSLASAAGAAETVFSSDFARDCFLAAKFGDPGQHGVDDCDSALIGASNPHDAAGILVDRGVIYLDYERFGLAMDDFNAAIKADASVGEAFTNRGAAFLGLRKFDQARADIDHGLALGSREPEKAYYNRGLADEFLGDEKAAYFDYLKASQIDPAWVPPKTELTRFTVTLSDGQASPH